MTPATYMPGPRQATAEEASILGVRKAALVTHIRHIRRTYYSDQGRPVETADIVVPAAQCPTGVVPSVPVQCLIAARPGPSLGRATVPEVDR